MTTEQARIKTRGSTPAGCFRRKFSPFCFCTAKNRRSPKEIDYCQNVTRGGAARLFLARTNDAIRANRLPLGTDVPATFISAESLKRAVAKSSTSSM